MLLPTRGENIEWHSCFARTNDYYNFIQLIELKEYLPEVLKSSYCVGQFNAFFGLERRLLVQGAVRYSVYF